MKWKHSGWYLIAAVSPATSRQNRPNHFFSKRSPAERYILGAFRESIRDDGGRTAFRCMRARDDVKTNCRHRLKRRSTVCIHAVIFFRSLSCSYFQFHLPTLRWRRESFVCYRRSSAGQSVPSITKMDTCNSDNTKKDEEECMPIVLSDDTNGIRGVWAWIANWWFTDQHYAYLMKRFV